MRVIRVLVGVVLLSVAAPALLAGAVAWYAMQHRDPSGEFRAPVETVAGSGYAVVVPDLDALLRRDVPFARAGRTTMRITASAPAAASAGGSGDVATATPLFVGLAAPGDVAALLAGSAYAELSGVSLGRGPLDARMTAVPGVRDVALGHPDEKQMWERSGIGQLTFDPSDWRGKAVALVVLAPDGTRLDRVSLAAAVRFGWLDSTTWGLLILGPVLLLLGFVTLAWPARQVVYVVAEHTGGSRADTAVEAAADDRGGAAGGAGIPQVPSRHVVAGPAYAGPTMLTWMDAPTMEVPVMGPRAGVYLSTFATSTADADDHAGGDHAEDDVIEKVKGGTLEDGLVAEWMTADAPPRPGLGTPEDWMRPAGDAAAGTAAETTSRADGEPETAGEKAAEQPAEEPDAPWPPAEEERRTPPALDVPTQEMYVLDDLPYVPLQFTGGERAPRLTQDRSRERLQHAGGPAAVDGPTLTGGTV
ncbi:MAG: hypothetical protein HOV79_15920 [Hamadaea sp.]|nr:hypothetical protein [Hamadaea sp.]